MTETELREATTIVRDEMRLAFDQQNETIEDLRDVLNRMMTLIEDHNARLERLEYQVFHVQPFPPMTSARHDH